MIIGIKKNNSSVSIDELEEKIPQANLDLINIDNDTGDKDYKIWIDSQENFKITHVLNNYDIFDYTKATGKLKLNPITDNFNNNTNKLISIDSNNNILAANGMKTITTETNLIGLINPISVVSLIIFEAVG